MSLLTVGAGGGPPVSGPVFLSTSGSDSNPGTSASPVLTVTKALTLLRAQAAGGSGAYQLVYQNGFTPPSGITTTYYVSPTGNDGTGTGAIGNPWLTPHFAMGNVGSAGTAVILRGGTYSITSQIYSATNGTATNPCAIYSYPGEVAVLDGTGLPGGTDLLEINGNYWVVGGMEIRNCPSGAGIDLYDCSNCKVLNNYVHDNWSPGITTYVDSVLQTNNIISGNVVYNNCKINKVSQGGVTWPSAITTAGSNSTTISYNVVTQNWGEGLDPYATDGTIAISNIVGDNFSVEMYFNDTKNLTATGNYVFNNNLTAFQNIHTSNLPAIAIAMSNELVSAPLVQNVLNNLNISNNWTDGGRYGLEFFTDQASGIRNSTFNNNTIINPTIYSLRIDADAGHTGNAISGNSFYQIGGTMTNGSASGFTSSNNNWYNGSSGVFAGSGDTAVNPLTGTPSLSLTVTGLGSAIGTINLRGSLLGIAALSSGANSTIIILPIAA